MINEQPSMRKEIQTEGSEELEDKIIGHSSPVVDSAYQSTSEVPQQIPGLPEKERLKAVKTKERKDKKSKSERKNSKDNVDTNEIWYSNR